MARILVIDDDSEFLDMMHQFLERDGEHQTMLVGDGNEGMTRAMSDPPDLAIIDVMMPGITGYEICRRLRAHPPTVSLPIIILTARGQAVDRQAAMDAGASAYMTKPVTLSELYETVNQLLGERETVVRQEPSSHSVVLFSLRGGVGVTTLAVNLAATLAKTGEEVCILDMCPSSGQVALQLRMRPDPNWSGLLRADRLDDDTVEGHLLRHSSGLHVLASPVLPGVGQQLSSPVVEGLMDILKQRFAVTIVDAPSVLDEATMAALDGAAAIGLVVTAESPSVQATISTFRVLEEYGTKFQVILNQVSPTPQPPPDAIERALKRPLVAAVPFDPGQARALVQGEPLALSAPESPLIQGVRAWAGQLAWVAAG